MVEKCTTGQCYQHGFFHKLNTKRLSWIIYFNSKYSTQFEECQHFMGTHLHSHRSGILQSSSLPPLEERGLGSQEGRKRKLGKVGLLNKPLHLNTPPPKPRVSPGYPFLKEISITTPSWVLFCLQICLWQNRIRRPQEQTFTINEI